MHRISVVSAHYCHGTLLTAFVLSVPGAKEVSAGKPVSGDTGKNLDAALQCLHSIDPANFPSTARYDYRITNAFSEPRAKSLGHGSSEAKPSEIRADKNVARVIEDLSGCELVILCGNKAQLLAMALKQCGKRVIKVPHPGNRGLNMAYPTVTTAADAVAWGPPRIAHWTRHVLHSIRASAAS